MCFLVQVGCSFSCFVFWQAEVHHGACHQHKPPGCLCAASSMVWGKKSCRNTQRLGKQLEMKLYMFVKLRAARYQRSCLEGRSAPPQVLFFTVHNRFSQQRDPSSAGSCLSSFQLPVIPAWLSSESMSEMFKQQQ